VCVCVCVCDVPCIAVMMPVTIFPRCFVSD
jgi:hypothetical protein